MLLFADAFPIAASASMVSVVLRVDAAATKVTNLSEILVGQLVEIVKMVRAKYQAGVSAIKATKCRMRKNAFRSAKRPAKMASVRLREFAPAKKATKWMRTEGVSRFVKMVVLMVVAGHQIYVNVLRVMPKFHPLSAHPFVIRTASMAHV